MSALDSTRPPSRFGLLDPCGASRSTEEGLRALGEWYEQRMLLCGGWSRENAHDNIPRAIGIHRFTEEQSAAIRRAALGLGRLYGSLGRLLSADGSVRAAVLDLLPRSEREWLEHSASSPFWAGTLRADFLFDADDEVRIVEVNSDNVGGCEDIHLQLSHFLAADCGEHRPAISAGRRAVERGLERFIEFHWERFSGRAGRPSTVHVAFEDRGDSYFLSRYMAAVLEHLGWNIRVIDAHALRWEPGRALFAAKPLGGEEPVELLLKHWLTCEMYEGSAERALKSPFRGIIEASLGRHCLVLNPLNDRLLFSKALLASLHPLGSDQPDPIRIQLALDDADVSFARAHIVPTDAFQRVATGHVLKASDSYGGRDVVLGSREQTPWVVQPLIRGERVDVPFRMTGQERVELCTVHVVHGMILHRVGPDDFHLSGVLTRVGPDPVVNWARGAQVVPGILTE